MTWTKVDRASETGGGFLEGAGFLASGFLEGGEAWVDVDKAANTWTDQSHPTDTWTNITKAT